MYVCTKCGNYKSFTVSIPETVTNVLTKVYGKEYGEESLFEKTDALMQDIEETMVCDECESMGIVELQSEYLDKELQSGLYYSLKMGVLDDRLMKKMKREARKVGDSIEHKEMEK